jgi:hypothetical protein
MAKAKQLSFQGKGFDKPKDIFGGSLLNGNNPKTKRPLETRFPLHLVLRAKKGGMRQPNAIKQVHDIVYKTAKKHGITIYKFANSGNHLHMALRLTHMALRLTRLMRWRGFIKEVSGRIASLMRKIKVTEPGESYWLYRPFTRIVRGWKKAFKNLLDYIELNILEAEGYISRKDTKTYRDLHAIWADP